MMLNITANNVLFYTIVNEQYPIMMNCISSDRIRGHWYI